MAEALNVITLLKIYVAKKVVDRCFFSSFFHAHIHEVKIRVKTLGAYAWQNLIFKKKEKKYASATLHSIP